MYCKKCGKQLKENAKFCTNCGAAVETETKKETLQTRKKGRFFKRFLTCVLFLMLSAGCGTIVYCITQEDSNLVLGWIDKYMVKSEKENVFDDLTDGGEDAAELRDVPELENGAESKSASESRDEAESRSVPESEDEPETKAVPESENEPEQERESETVLVSEETESNELEITCSVEYAEQVNLGSLEQIQISQDMVTQSSYVTSELTPDYNYTGWSAFDKDNISSWQEGAEGIGTGEYVCASWGYECKVKTLVFLLGNHRDSGQYIKNNRPKNLTVCLGNEEFWVEFPDEMRTFAVVFSAPVPASSLKVILGDAYLGNKFPETAISEIGIYQEP